MRMKFTMAQMHTTRHTQAGKYDVVPIMCSFLQPLFRYESKKGVRHHSAQAMPSNQQLTCSTLTSRVCNPTILQRESAANTQNKRISRKRANKKWAVVAAHQSLLLDRAAVGRKRENWREVMQNTSVGRVRAALQVRPGSQNRASPSATADL